MNVPPASSLEQRIATDTLLQVVDNCMDSSNAARLESQFSKDELKYALDKLGNEKTPSLDGISKEFMVVYWDVLTDLVASCINAIWMIQNMDSDLKKGIIKLLPKQTFCNALGHWRPITMLGILYKIMAKAIALRIGPILRKSIHTIQSGFIGGRSILDNILTVQMGIEHAQASKQELVMLQLDFAKAFDTVRWDFIEKTMLKMGFGPRMAHVIFLLAENASSVINLNERLTEPISICRSVRQGCPLSPLLFAVATHPLFCYLESQASQGEILGLRINQKTILGWVLLMIPSCF